MDSNVHWRTRERALWSAKWASIFGEWWLMRKVKERVREDRRFTISDLSLHFPHISRTLLYDMVSSHLGRKRPYSMRRVYKTLCPAAISASIMAANLWEKNSLKNIESDNNKILYKTLLDFVLQRNGIYSLNKPRRCNRSPFPRRCAWPVWFPQVSLNFTDTFGSSIGGSVVECSPATRAARVRFPADAINIFLTGKSCFFNDVLPIKEKSLKFKLLIFWENIGIQNHFPTYDFSNLPRYWGGIDTEVLSLSMSVCLQVSVIKRDSFANDF